MLRPLYHLAKQERLKVISRALALFCCLLAINVILQIANRAYVCDFGGHPDEASHVVTGLMVRDYLAGGFLESTNPLTYAQSYYAAYPKVALGHYPPVFYVVTGIWLLFGVSSTSILVLAAVVTSFCGLLTFMLGRMFMGRSWALGAVLIFTLSSLTQRYTSVFMSDMLLLSGCLLSAVAFVKFMDRGRRVDSLLFGMLAAITILTKSSGLLLGMLPVFALFFSRKIQKFRSHALWISPLVVIFMAGPWLLIFHHITAEGAMSGGINSYIAKSAPFFVSAMGKVFGSLVLILTFGEILYCTLSGAILKRAVSDGEAVMIALVLSGLAFYLVVPAGLEPRYLLVIVPAVLLLAFKAAQRICYMGTVIFRLRGNTAFFVRGLFGIIFAAGIAIERFELNEKNSNGFREIIEAVQDIAIPGEDALLVVSDSRGEGAMVAASVLASNKRLEEGVRVCRGSKILSSSDWLGRNYRPNFNSADELRDFMTSGEVQFMALDLGIPGNKRVGYHDLAAQVVANYAAEFIEMGRFPTRRTGGIEADVVLYRLEGTGSRCTEGE
jgi:hypothetical protein